MPSRSMPSAMLVGDHALQGPHMSTERCTNDCPHTPVPSAMSRIYFASSSVKSTTMVGPGLASVVCFESSSFNSPTSAFSLSTSAFSSTTSAFSCWISSPTWTVSIPPRRRARGVTWQKVTPKVLFGPKRDYDVIVAHIDVSSRPQMKHACDPFSLRGGGAKTDVGHWNGAPIESTI